MTSQTTVRTLLILGASGDLTGRLLLPGLASLVVRGRADGLALVGAGSDPWTPDQWQERLATAMTAPIAPEAAEGAAGAGPAGEGATTAGSAGAAVDGSADGAAALQQMAAASTYHQLDVTAEGALAGLLASLAGPVAVYFALPPKISQLACEALRPKDVPAGTRLVLEKPFGSSAESARDLNRTLAKLVAEDHIHRVDHFLGKATVLNVLGLRFANNFLEPVWNREHIEKVEIIFDEDLALEGRARYYDGAGALRDMIQSHLLQIMAFMAIEPPASIHEKDLRDAVATVLRASSIREPLTESTKRARYTAGTINGRQVPDYAAEDGVDAAKETETLAEVRVNIDNWRWQGVPFVLRSGKALGRKRKEAVVTFRPVPHLPKGFTGIDTPNQLRIGFGPDTLQFDVDVNGPGDIFSLSHATLNAELSSADLLPYGEVLEGILAGDPLLSVRGDTAEDCWRIVEPVLKAWQDGTVPLDTYYAGSSGPASWSGESAAQ